MYVIKRESEVTTMNVCEKAVRVFGHESPFTIAIGTLCELGHKSTAERLFEALVEDGDFDC